MGHVHVFHQQVAVAYDGCSFRGRATTDGDILAYAVVIANLASRFLALEFQVLGLGRDAGTGKELVVRADAGTVVDGHAVLKHIIVAHHGVLVDIAERADDVVVAKFGFRMDKCHGMNLVHIL